MNTTTLLIQTLSTLLVSVVLVGWFVRPATDPKEVASWAKAHDLEITRGNRPMVEYYVKLAITLRVIGGVSGMVIGSLFDDAIGVDTSSGIGFWTWVVLGWLLGASWAEVRLTRPPSTGGALLTPRQVDHYLPRALYLAPIAASAVVVALATALILAPAPETASPFANVTDQLPDVAFVLSAVVVMAIAALVQLAVRAVVARRQPTGPADVVAADDAIRASAVHHLAGGGTAAILFVGSQVAIAGLGAYTPPYGLRGWVPGVLFLSGILAWRFFAYRRWSVRRGGRALVTG